MIQMNETDFGTLAICAIRYCQGRMTYMPDLVRKIVRPYLQTMQDRDIIVMLRDCKFQEEMNLYGDEKIDKPDWLRWKADLEKEAERRQLGWNV